jgi:hypothetical protein
MGLRQCLLAEWAAWTIKPTLNRNDEGPDLFRAFFLSRRTISLGCFLTTPRKLRNRVIGTHSQRKKAITAKSGTETPMKIVIPDDYQNLLDRLDCYNLIQQHEIIRYREPACDLDQLVERLSLTSKSLNRSANTELDKKKTQYRTSQAAARRSAAALPTAISYLGALFRRRPPARGD